MPSDLHVAECTECMWHGLFRKLLHHQCAATLKPQQTAATVTPETTEMVNSLCHVSSVCFAGNIRPVAALPQPDIDDDSTSPEAAAKALLSNIPEPGLIQGSPRLLPPAAESTADLQSEPLPEPDVRQCYQIVNGRLTLIPLQLLLPKPKPKGAMKKGSAAGGAAGTDASST